MSRFCANCGTEVEDLAVFCPTCGQPIDQASETEIPAAPAWPDPEPAEAVAEAPPPAAEAPRWEAPTRTESTAPPPAPPVGPVQPADRRGPAPINNPLTMPVTLSAWLIGGGAALAAVGVLVGLFGGFLNPIDLILLILLAGIAATVFLSANVPAIPHLRLITLVIVLIGFGMALDRIGFGSAGADELLLFLGSAAAAIGAIILELGRDQPLGGPQP
jgi:zinc-ribbon domain